MPVNIQLQQGIFGPIIGASTDQLVLSVPVVLSINNPGSATLSGILWSITDKPEGSTVTLATPTTAVSGFTPDKAGTYLINLSVVANGILENPQIGAAVLTTGLHYRIPATTEIDEFDNGALPKHGWGPAVKVALQDIDDGYVAFITAVPAHIGVQYAVLLEDPIGTSAWEKLTGDKILDKYTITSFQTTWPTIVEVGSTAIQPAFTATYNRAATGVSINDGTNTDVITLPATSFAYNGSSLPSRNYTNTTVNQQQTFTLSATDGVGTTSALAKITWEPLVYYGSQVPFANFSAVFPNGDFENVSSTPWQFTTSGDGYSAVTNTGVAYLINNGGFETGDVTGWTVVTSPAIISHGQPAGVAEAVDPTTLPDVFPLPPLQPVDTHSGTYCAVLGSDPISGSFEGDVSMSQNVDIPSLGTTTLSFWFKTNAPDAVAYDWFQAHVRDSAGTTVLIDLFAFPVATGDSSLNHRSTPTGGSNPPPVGEIGPVFYNNANSPNLLTTWHKITANLTPYAGQTVKLFFLAKDDGVTPFPTQLFLDDIQLKNTYAHSATKFGQIYSNAAAGGMLYQTLLIPTGTTFIDGYYKAYGDSGPGLGDSQFILLMDSLLSSTLATVVNVDAYTGPGSWQHFSTDVSAYAGTTIAVVAKVQSTVSLGLRALEIDDFSISTTGADVAGYLATLSSQLQPSKVSSSIVITINSDEYFIWVGPTSYNAIADNFIDEETGLPIGMTKTNLALSVINQYGVTIPYDIWQSEYGSFGQFTFVVRNNNE